MEKSKLYGIISLVLAVVLLLNFIPFPHSMEKKRADFVSLNEDIKKDLLSKGKYKCCIEKLCTYCLVKEGECNCLEDLVNGKHPCGECIGEILEGHGNSYLAEYFAVAIAEKTGELEAIKRIISEKYGISIGEQNI